jgi:hypothetical protein
MFLEGMEHTLAEERKSSPAKPHTFNQLQLVHFSFDDTI